ncbi:MAG: NAD(+) synthase [Fibrobacteria bacterium]|nr:NAD(+) synthase [Fibrobacteria bacterium]
MIVRISAATLPTTPLDWSANLAACRQALAQAQEGGADILLLPELCLTGYGCEDAFLAPWVAERAWESLSDLAREIPQGMLVGVGIPVRLRGKLHNGAALLTRGKVEGIACKRHLAREGIHYEPRWFTPWPAGRCVDSRTFGCPVGDQVFDWGGIRIGFEICEDAWAAERPGLDLAAADCDVILSPSASHFAMGKDDVRERLVLDGSRSLGVAYAYANLSGNEAGRIVYDGCARVAASGVLLSRSPALSFHGLHLATADVEVEDLRTRRSVASHPSARPVPRITRIEGGPTRRRTVPAPALPSPRPDAKEQFGRATALGMWDYLHKSRSQGFVLSLSGGADSAACATLVHLACHFALSERGERQVRQDLSHIPDLPQTLDARSLSARLLVCAWQATRNSGTVTRDAARRVAEGCGAPLIEWDVDDLVQGYLALGEQAMGRKLSWSTDDIALQNIQARVRAPSVWLLANATGRLLITTSNRSEMAVGYATMDGDTSGSLSPLAGIDKSFLLRWLALVEQEGIADLPPLSWLSAITAQAPTAELRPREEGKVEQTDEADLMPYPLLSRLEILSLRERKSPAQCLDTLLQDPAWNGDPERLASWVRRFFRLWARNQWKRERYAPSFHLDEHNLDPRSWCRFPILSGGFEEELARLELPR